MSNLALVYRLLLPPILNKVQNKGTQGVQARYGAELPPSISFVRCPGRPVILGEGKFGPFRSAIRTLAIPERCGFSPKLKWCFTGIPSNTGLQVSR